MEETQDWLESLLNLQELDTRLDRMNEQVQTAPQQKKEAQDNLDAQQQAALAAKEDVRHKELEISSINAEIDVIEAHKMKALEQANSIKDNHTYKALLAEVKSLENQVLAKEDNVLDLMEELETLKSSFKQSQAKLQEAVTRVEQMIGDLDTRVQNCQKQIGILGEKREEQAKFVDEEILMRYSRIKQSHGGRKFALVEINGDKCGFCHLTLTKQEMLQAKKRVALNACSNCGSLLYS
jgi:hypothetical protein